MFKIICDCYEYTVMLVALFIAWPFFFSFEWNKDMGYWHKSDLES